MRDTLREIGITARDVPLLGGQGGTWGMLVEHATISGVNLVLHGDSAPWVIDAAKKLETIGKLSSGWDSYGGAPLDPSARKLTVSALGWLGNRDLPVPAVVLGSGGSVQLEWRANGRELEIELDRNGIEFLKVHPNNETEEGEDKANLPETLRGLTWWLLHG